MTSSPSHGSIPRLQTRRFLMLYALAAAGGSAAYAPFLTLLLPMRATQTFGESGIEVLSYTAFAGALAASAGSIVFGWASDRSGQRRGWVLAGALLSSALLVAMRFADTLEMLLALIVAWQIGLNMMLCPLLAWAGDSIPDEQKGVLGGVLSLAPALGALIGTLITIPGLADPDGRLILNAAIVLAMVLPIVVFGRPVPMPQLMAPPVPADGSAPVTAPPIAQGGGQGQNVARMWLARLLIQIAEAALFAFLLIWLRILDEGVTDNDTASIFTGVLLVCVPLAFLAGRWSDRTGRPRVPLAVTAGAASIGLLVMAAAPSVSIGIAGYLIFGVLAGVFLALHSSQTLRVLPRPGTRGRDLGIFNLTNTVPSLIMPWLVLAIIPSFGFGALFLLLAALAGIACLLLATMERF